ncbi:monosaccharide ABC transporter ATP-binding protein (CUT2 family) [Rhodobacter sp. JA431]|nr:monosaccharide ABC transporter ATP-binding protein (CUT2 family) [Rhodobacter sp. JA431]
MRGYPTSKMGSAMNMAIEAKSLTKTFGSVRALTEGRLRVAEGEIHALLGANGCGKSTLSKIIAGTHAPSSGSLRINGQEVSFASPRAAEDAGVALFYQELSLIPQLSVEANIFLGREPRTAVGAIDRKAMRAMAQKLIDRFGEAVGPGLRPEARVSDLQPGERQIVEILKVYAKNPRIVIMDEATAALDSRQVAVFFDFLREKRGEGVSTVFISHRLAEVFAICDRITVMRNGETVAEMTVADTTQEEVVRMMVGDIHRPQKRAAKTGTATPIFEVRNVTGARFHDVSLSLSPGEILGLGGLQGQGQSALLRGLFGITPLTAGTLHLEGRACRMRRPAQAMAEGLAYVSGDRVSDSVLQGRSIYENLLAALVMREGKLWLSPRQMAPRLSAEAASLKTKYAQLSDAINTLSGGNQQKVFIARWLAMQPRILLLDDPTKGIDLGAKADLFALIRDLADKGVGIILYSSEESELLDNCDRIAVFNGGAVVTELSGATLDSFHLTRAAFGES